MGRKAKAQTASELLEDIREKIDELEDKISELEDHECDESEDDLDDAFMNSLNEVKKVVNEGALNFSPKEIEILKKSVDNLEKLPEDIKKDLIFKNNYNPLGRNLLDEKQPFDIYDIIRDKEIENEIDKSRVTPGFNAFKVFSNHIDKDKKTTSSIR